jgi:hypothetical protein
MKTTLLALLLTTSIAFANNEIYLEQEGSTGTFDITQVGSSNKIGSSTDISTIAGDSSDFDISQIGSGNTLDIEWNGDQTDFDLYIEGNSNLQDILVTGNQNIFTNTILGDGNDISIKKDDTSAEASSISQQYLKNYIIGSGNTLDFYLNENIAAVSDISLIGNSNTITSIQEGGNLGLGHSQIVQLQGDSNILNLVQSGSEYQTLELTHYGNDSTFTIIQSDGTYTAGLEGLGTISNFDGSYTQPVPTPDFAQGPFIEVGPFGP